MRKQPIGLIAWSILLTAVTAWAQDNVSQLDVTPFGSPHITHHYGVPFSLFPETRRTHNLSEMGPTDWVHWGFVSSTTTRQTRKNIPHPWIDLSLVQPAGFSETGSRGGPLLFDYGDGLQGYTWNAGDDAPARGQLFRPAGANPQVYHGWGFSPPAGSLGNDNKPIGQWGFRIAVPAPTKPATLYFHTGVWNAIGDLTVSLLDAQGQAVLQHTAPNVSANRSQYRVRFQAAEAGQQLVIEWLYAENTHETGIGAIRMGGVTLRVDAALGDFNGDGILSGLDIPGFKQALADPYAWAAANPGRPHPIQLGDFNGDGAFSGLDIPGFKQALAGGEPSGPPLKTTGAIADGPLQVGTWLPLAQEMPPWVFPMVYHVDAIPSMPVEQYAMRFVATIQSFPQDRPVWLQSHRWFGRYTGGGWDTHNVLAHAADATPDGTPGMWPAEGKAVWLARQREFLSILKEYGCRLDFWPLDHETTTQEWASNWSPEFSFRNIVYDPRWASGPMPWDPQPLPLPGIAGVRGVDLLHPSELSGQPIWTRTVDDVQTRDYRLACDAVTVGASLMPETVLNEVFAQPVFDAYPHAGASDYNKFRRPITGLIRARNPDAPLTGMSAWDIDRMNRMKRFWEAIDALRPDLTQYQGVGTHASPSLYGGDKWRRDPLLYGPVKPGDDVTDMMLRHIDDLIAWYGDPAKVAPWITLPNFVPSRHFDPAREGQRSLSPGEYERLLVGMAERGVQKFILWFSESMNTVEANQEFLQAVQKAYEAAEARIAQ